MTRLIDADALIKQIREKDHWLIHAHGSFREFAIMVANAPTVEPTFERFRAMCCETCQAAQSYPINKAMAKLTDEYARPEGWQVFDSESINMMEDHYYYLLAVKGYETPIKAKFHDDPIPVFTHFCMMNNKAHEAVIDLDNITHWQYLPEMPRKGADNDQRD